MAFDAASLPDLFAAVGTAKAVSPRYIINDAMHGAMLYQRFRPKLRAEQKGRAKRRRSAYMMRLDLLNGIPDKRESRSYGERLAIGFAMQRGVPC